MANLSFDDEKRILRRHYRQILAALGEPTLGAASREIIAHLASALAAEDEPIATFAALPGEIDLAGLHRALPDRQLAYPLVLGEALQFHLVEDPAGLTPGSFGVPEPDPGHHPEIPLHDLTTFLCPGLAFSPDGGRLGRGGGFYDRALARARPTAIRIGVGLDSQSAPHLPMAAHDLPMTHRASESGFRRLPSGE